MTVLPEHAAKPAAAMGAGQTYAWYALGVLTLANIVAAIDRFMMGVIVVPLKGALALSDTQLGLLQGLGFALLYCAAGLPLGRLADRMNRKLLIAVGCAMWTVATAACAFADSFASLFVARIFVGLGEATLLPAALSLLGAYFPPQRLGLSTGIFILGSSLGKSAAFIGGGALLAFFAATGGVAMGAFHFEPWQALFIVCAAPGLLTTALTGALREPPRAAREGARRGSVAELWRYVSERGAAFGLYLIAAICVTSLAHVFAAWAPSFMVRRFALGISNAASIVGMTALIASPIGALLGGWVNDRLTRSGARIAPLTIMMATLVLAAPASALAFYFSDNLVLSVGAYGVAQALVLAGGPQAYTGIQAMTPPQHRGLMSATFLAVTSLFSLGMGPAVIGLFSDNVFQSAANGLGCSLTAVILMLALIGICAGALAQSPLRGIAQHVAGEARQP